MQAPEVHSRSERPSPRLQELGCGGSDSLPASKQRKGVSLSIGICVGAGVASGERGKK